MVRGDTPLKKPRKTVDRITAKSETPAPEPRRILPDFRIGAKSQTAIPPHDLRPAIGDRLEAAPLRMDHKAHKRLKAGRTDPEARIDLHGMTAEHAHAALSRFILSARARGLRTVLVITGKGRRDRSDDPIPRPHGVLRHEVPRWLSVPPLASAVLQIVPAHRRHGGSGAYYVHLARLR